MTKQQFLRELETELALDPGSLQEGQALSEIKGWDSMAAVQFIALADEKAGVAIPDNQIARARTVSDLLSLLDGHLTS